MNKLPWLIILLTTQLYSQNITLKLDTAIYDASFYQKGYTLRKKDDMGGQGWEINKTSNLRHAFYGDMPAGSKFRNVGTWTMRNDSLVFFIKEKNLVNKYGYKSQESFKPVIVSWELRSDLKNDSAKLLIFRNKLIILNRSNDPRELVNELQGLIFNRFESLKNDLDPNDPYYFFELNEGTAGLLKDLLYEKSLFGSVETKREFE
jgi:hypothetical protein